ncbi:hypothetical protein GCM10025779_15850 [Arthrobacter cryoconiti]
MFAVVLWDGFDDGPCGPPDAHAIQYEGYDGTQAGAGQDQQNCEEAENATRFKGLDAGGNERQDAGDHKAKNCARDQKWYKFGGPTDQQRTPLRGHWLSV